MEAPATSVAERKIEGRMYMRVRGATTPRMATAGGRVSNGAGELPCVSRRTDEGRARSRRPGRVGIAPGANRADVFASAADRHPRCRSSSRLSEIKRRPARPRCKVPGLPVATASVSTAPTKRRRSRRIADDEATFKRIKYNRQATSSSEFRVPSSEQPGLLLV